MSPELPFHGYENGNSLAFYDRFYGYVCAAADQHEDGLIDGWMPYGQHTISITAKTIKGFISNLLYWERKIINENESVLERQNRLAKRKKKIRYHELMPNFYNSIKENRSYPVVYAGKRVYVVDVGGDNRLWNDNQFVLWDKVLCCEFGWARKIEGGIYSGYVIYGPHELAISGNNFRTLAIDGLWQHKFSMSN